MGANKYRASRSLNWILIDVSNPKPTTFRVITHSKPHPKSQLMA